MKKFLSTILVLLSICETAWAFPTDTTGWVCTPEHLSAQASEIQLKSDLKNDYGVFQTTLTNLTGNTVDVSFPYNNDANSIVQKLLTSGITIKELMVMPKQIAVDSYNEDVGTGKIAVARKGLIYIVASAGAVVAGAGLLGIYPQQKTEEFISHKKIKKEYKKLNTYLINEVTLAPLEQKDIFMILPITNPTCVIKSTVRGDENELYSDYHQL